MNDDPWSILGIAPTEDRAAIRSAYAARLKQIDTDADPDSFMQLRSARDAVLSGAAVALPPSAPDIAEVVLADGAPETQPAESPPPDPEADLRGRAFHRLQYLLFPGDETPPLTGDHEQELCTCAEILLADPRLEEVGYYAEAEAWFAGCIAHAIPRSDVLIRPVGLFFRWHEQDHVHQSPAVSFVLDRAKALGFRDAVREKGHRLHKAWRELSRPASESSRRGRVSKKRVHELLVLIRTRYPELEQELDWYRISLWEDPPARSWLPLGPIVFLIWIALKAIIVVATTDPTPPPAPAPSSASFERPLQDTMPAIDRALLDLHLYRADFDAVAINNANPALFAAMRDEWQRARQSEAGENEFATALGKLVDALYANAMAHADYAALKRAAKLHRAEAEALRSTGWEPCARYFSGEDIVKAPHTEELERLRREHVSATLLALKPPLSTAPPPVRERTFRIPGAVIERLIARAGLPEPELRAALHGEGSNQARCRAGLALYDVVIELPRKQALPLLSHL